MMDLKEMYGSTPERFRSRVRIALAQAEAQPVRKCVYGWRTVLIAALALTMVLGVAAAAFHSQVAEYFGGFYGGLFGGELGFQRSKFFCQTACRSQFQNSFFQSFHRPLIDPAAIAADSGIPEHFLHQARNLDQLFPVGNHIIDLPHDQTENL